MERYNRRDCNVDVDYEINVDVDNDCRDCNVEGGRER